MAAAVLHFSGLSPTPTVTLPPRRWPHTRLERHTLWRAAFAVR